MSTVLHGLPLGIALVGLRVEQIELVKLRGVSGDCYR
jgi:hypothetical protein